MRPINCPNCGAPLHSNKCEYCGSEFVEEQTIKEIENEIELLKLQLIQAENNKFIIENYKRLNNAFFEKFKFGFFSKFLL